MEPSSRPTSPLSPAGSLSRIEMEIRFTRTGEIAKAEIFRHLSPSTVNNLLRIFPIQGRLNHFEDKLVYIMTEAVTGVEKGKKDFMRGEIAFMSMNNAICFVLNDCSVARPFNPLGKVLKGIEIFDSTQPGDSAVLQLTKET
jgi:hypothetical protein